MTTLNNTGYDRKGIAVLAPVDAGCAHPPTRTLNEALGKIKDGLKVTGADDSDEAVTHSVALRPTCFRRQKMSPHLSPKSHHIFLLGFFILDI
jgi:hypothetical protein